MFVKNTVFQYLQKPIVDNCLTSQPNRHIPPVLTSNKNLSANSRHHGRLKRLKRFKKSEPPGEYIVI